MNCRGLVLGLGVLMVACLGEATEDEGAAVESWDEWSVPLSRAQQMVQAGGAIVDCPQPLMEAKNFFTVEGNMNLTQGSWFVSAQFVTVRNGTTMVCSGGNGGIYNVEANAPPNWACFTVDGRASFVCIPPG